MTEAMIVEAVKAAGMNQAAAQAVAAPAPTADPASVERFNAAMAVNAPQAVGQVPFASEATAAWRSAQVNNQGILHRVRALCELKSDGNVAAAELVELQYEVMNLSFQQEVVTKVADKSSNAIQTLIKNQ